MTVLAFSVLGRPAPQGSKRAISTPGGVRLLEQSKRVAPYRALVVHAAREALDELAPDAAAVLYDAPVSVQVDFLFARPKAHHRTGRNASLLSDRAPARPTSRQTGDVEKLVRALNDALVTAGVIRDDSQVVWLHASKRYANPGAPEQTIVEIRPLAKTIADAEQEALAA